MIKSLKKNNMPHLRNKIVNALMKSGGKKTGEKILTKFLKLLQKSTDKDFKIILQSAIINSTSTFKLNEQSIKKGKRRATKYIPSFIISNSLRIMTTLKLIKKVSVKSRGSNSFYQSLTTEVLAASALKGQSVDQKNELQQQILINKRYLSKFRW